MALSKFDDKARRPDEQDLRGTLSAQWDLWTQLREHVAEAYSGSTEEWKFYGRASGWTMLLKHKKRTIMYLFPAPGLFTVLFVFGEAAVARAGQADLPPDVMTAIRDAKAHVEGRSFSVQVTTTTDLEVVKRLIAIKMTA